jgi:hypothetical protein
MPRRVTMRPRFEILLPTVEDDCMRRLGKLLEEDESPYVGQVLKKHAFIQLPREERSLLSPYLNLNIIKRDGKCYLDGRFTPKPEVWMGFMAIYGVLGMIGLSGLMYGFAQMTVKETPWGFWAVPASLALFAFVYGAALIGQGLTSDEMYRMRAYIECLIRRQQFDRDRSYIPGQDPQVEMEKTAAEEAAADRASDD